MSAKGSRWRYRVEDGMRCEGAYLRRMDEEGWDLVSIAENTQHVLAQRGERLFTVTWRRPADEVMPSVE